MSKTYEIGQSYIRFDFKADENFKTVLEQYLLYKGKYYSNKIYNQELLIDGFFFSVELEEGSLKSRLKIFGKIAVATLVGYGGLRSGIDYLIQDSQSVTEHIANDLCNEHNIDRALIGRVERRLGVPGKIKRVLVDLERLKDNRNKLSVVAQSDLLKKIIREYEALILELDQPEIMLLAAEIKSNNIPLPEPTRDGNHYLLNRHATRVEEIRISENEISEVKHLPPPKIK